MAISYRGKLLKAPDIYMKKIACGPESKNVIDLNAPVADNIYLVAKALGKSPEETTVGLLDRPRHRDLIQEILKTKARIKLVSDGDLSLALESVFKDSPVDLLMGTGGAPEGVLAATALKCLGGGFQAQLVYQNKDERQRTEKTGINSLDKIWTRDELVSGEALFFATGVTSGNLIEGVSKKGASYFTNTFILSPKGKKELKSEYKKHNFY